MILIGLLLTSARLMMVGVVARVLHLHLVPGRFRFFGGFALLMVFMFQAGEVGSRPSMWLFTLGNFLILTAVFVPYSPDAPSDAEVIARWLDRRRSRR